MIDDKVHAGQHSLSLFNFDLQGSPMLKKIHALTFLVVTALIFSFFTRASVADEKPLIDISKVLPPEVRKFVYDLDDIAKKSLDGSDEHKYVYPEHPTSADAICSTRNNPGCTQEKVFDTMLSEARFMSPASKQDEKRRVFNGARLQLDNGIDFHGFPIAFWVAKPALTAFIYQRAGITQFDGITLSSYSEADRDKYLAAAGELQASLPTIYDNKIEVEVNRGTFTTINHTLPSHLLYNGYVSRTVEPPDAAGNIFVTTRGWGSGNKFGVAKALNLVVYPAIWEKANDQLREAMKFKGAPVLIIDRSGSLTDQPGAMQQIQSKASEVVQAIQENVGQAAVINFAGAGSAVLDADFTPDTATLLRAIQSPSTAKGGTAIYSAVVGAVSVAKKNGQQSMLILFTDGMNNEGSGLGQAVSYCKQNKVPVIVVGFTGTEDRNVAAMSQLANGTDGFYVDNERVSVQEILKRFKIYSENKVKVAPPPATAF